MNCFKASVVIFRIISTIVGVACLLMSGPAFPQTITGVMVFPIDARGSNLNTAQVSQLMSYLTTRLTMVQISVMPESDIRSMLKTLKLQSYDDCFDDRCRIELGKALSADKTLSVQILHEDEQCRMTATMYDIRREISVAAADTATGCRMPDLRSGIAVIASQLRHGLNTFRRMNPENVDQEFREAGIAPSMQGYPEQQSVAYNQKTEGSIRVKGSVRGIINGPLVPTTPRIKKSISRTKTEWFSLRFNGGSYGGGVDASLFTVRWKYFLWEILRGGGNVFGPGFGSGSDSMGWAAYAGTAFGYPLHIGKDNKHEFRFMTGLFGGVINQPIDYKPDRDWFLGNESVGPFVLIEIYYVLHLLHDRALQTGLSIMVPTLERHNDLPDPLLVVFIGFRI
ncbi:MAG TPA: hypothetical protein PLC24_01025 [Myxococcota bacterium]|nr:hypothetical protein [Myxococcota bacterium]